MKKTFSIIIPTKGNFRKNKFPSFCEVIYINKFTKSEARNFGAKKAKGKYLIHIDKDNKISDEVLTRCKNLLDKNNIKAIVLEEFINNPITIWEKARSLERKILAGNKTLSTPQIIEKKLFKKIGGYDERFNELDDWALWMRLPKNLKIEKIKGGTSIFEPTNIGQILSRRFKKGRELKYFKEVYKKIPQVNIKNSIRSYLKTLPNLPLLILKTFDYLGLSIGNLFPIRPRIDILYQDKNIAERFDTDQLGVYGTFKDNLEKRSILRLVGNSKSILDLGCGTGRITKFLVNKKYKVIPADISKAMIDEFPKSLPNPVLIKSNKLPFKNNQFDTVLSLRVIWHIKDQVKINKFFSEAVRVSKKDIVIDFSLIGSLSDHTFTMDEIKKLAQKNNLKINKTLYLPLTRLLIKFTKT